MFEPSALLYIYAGYGFGSIFRQISELASLCKGQKSSNITFRFSFKVFLTLCNTFVIFFSYFKVLFDLLSPS